MKTTLKICFVIISTLIVASNCLNLHKKSNQHNLQHNVQQYQKHLVHKFLSHKFSTFSHKLSKFTHYQQQDQSIHNPEEQSNKLQKDSYLSKNQQELQSIKDDKVSKQGDSKEKIQKKEFLNFLCFLISDVNILDNLIDQSQLSKDQIHQIKQYLLDHIILLDAIFLEQVDVKTATCFKKLNDEQRRRIYSWILDEVEDKQAWNLNNEEFEEFGDNLQQKIYKKGIKDEQIHAILSKCDNKFNPED